MTAMAWADGAIVPESECAPDIWSPTFHYGYGVFEGIRVYPTASGPAVFRLAEHIRRLLDSARSYPPLDTAPWTAAELAAAAVDTVRANGHEACYVRPVIYLYTGDIGNDPTLGKVQTTILVAPWGGLLKPGALRLTVSPWRRAAADVLPTGAKGNGGYANLMLAKGDAVRRGFHDALVLDRDGWVVEATGANVFALIGDELVSPGLAQGALPGITRDTVFALAADAGYRVCERPLGLTEIHRADEVFLTGTGAEIRAVAYVDEQRIGRGTTTLSDAISDAYQDVVHGRDARRSSWLTPIEAPIGEGES